jgi:hypothetical protein
VAQGVDLEFKPQSCKKTKKKKKRTTTQQQKQANFIKKIKTKEKI